MDLAGWRNELNEANAAQYGRFQGERYARLRNIVWILGGDVDSEAWNMVQGAVGASGTVKVEARAGRSGAAAPAKTGADQGRSERLKAWVDATRTRIELTVTFEAGRRHLPVVSLKRVA